MKKLRYCLYFCLGLVVVLFLCSFVVLDFVNGDGRNLNHQITMDRLDRQKYKITLDDKKIFICTDYEIVDTIQQNVKNSSILGASANITYPSDKKMYRIALYNTRLYNNYRKYYKKQYLIAEILCEQYQIESFK